jgi:hypothetical protein
MSLLLPLLFSCDGAPAKPSVDDDDAGEVDTAATTEAVTGALAADSDLCAWDDGETATVAWDPPPDGYIGSPFPPAYAPCLDGLLWLGAATIEHEYGRLTANSVNASFFAVTDGEADWLPGEWLDPQKGVDDCGYATLAGDGYSEPPEAEWLAPDRVRMTMGDRTFELTPEEGTTVFTWSGSLDETGPAWGAPYGLAIEGSDGMHGYSGFAGVELPELATLPEALSLTTPVLSAHDRLSRSDLPIRWTGTSDGTVWLEMESGAGLLRCEMADDGDFTVPGSLIALFPPGDTPMLRLTRRGDAWLGTSAGRSFHGIGEATFEVWSVEIP